MVRSLSLAFVVLASLAFAACGDPKDGASTTETTIPTRAVTTPTEPSASPTATPISTRTATPSPTPTPPPANEPAGFPLAAGTRVGLVDYGVPGRPIRWGAGPTAADFTRQFQAGADDADANAGGWNCRTHVAFEGRAAVDWYIPPGTPVLATMDGTATLYAITTSNAFDVYGAERAPYVGYPSSDAVVAPFPGPGGGKGVFIEVTGPVFITESAHLDLAPTLAMIPEGAFLPGFANEPGLVQRFAPLRDFRDATPIATWEVRRGALIGYSGDSGYSEAPHLHYTVRRPGGELLCPTGEAGFPDGGWLLR